MAKRKARDQTEIDFLPPFGKPEVVTTGNHAADLAVGGLLLAGSIAFARTN